MFKNVQKCAKKNNKIVQKCANLCKKLRAKPKKLHSWKKLAQTASPASPSFSISALVATIIVKEYRYLLLVSPCDLPADHKDKHRQNDGVVTVSKFIRCKQ